MPFLIKIFCGTRLSLTYIFLVHKSSLSKSYFVFNQTANTSWNSLFHSDVDASTIINIFVSYCIKL